MLSKRPYYKTACFFIFLLSFIFFSFGSAYSESLWAETDDGRKIHIFFVRAEGGEKRNFPVILCHGLGTQGKYWYFEEKINWARKFAEEGFNVYVPDLRGVGKSKGSFDFGFEDYLYDVSAIIKKVKTLEGSEKVHWIGHSMGGMVIYLAVSRKPEISQSLASFTAISSPYTIWTPFEIFKLTRKNFDELSYLLKKVDRVHFSFFSSLISFFLPVFDFSRLFLPFADLEYLVWNIDNVSRDYRKSAMKATADVSTRVLEKFLKVGIGYEDFGFNLDAFDVPSLFVVGVKDYLATPPAVKLAFLKSGSKNKSFVLAGVGEGFRADYGHVDITASDFAVEEIFPVVLNHIEKWDGSGGKSRVYYKPSRENDEDKRAENLYEDNAFSRVIRTTQNLKAQTPQSNQNYAPELSAKIFRKSKISFLLVQDLGFPGDVWKSFSQKFDSKELSYVFPKNLSSVLSIHKIIERFCNSFTSDLNVGVFHGFSGTAFFSSERKCFDAVFLIAVPFSEISSFYSFYLRDRGNISSEMKEKVLGIKETDYFEFDFSEIYYSFDVSNLKRIFYVISTGDRAVWWWNVRDFLNIVGDLGLDYHYIILSRANFSDELSHTELIYGKKAEKYVIPYIIRQIESLKK